MTERIDKSENAVNTWLKLSKQTIRFMAEVAGLVEPPGVQENGDTGRVILLPAEEPAAADAEDPLDVYAIEITGGLSDVERAAEAEFARMSVEDRLRALSMSPDTIPRRFQSPVADLTKR